ncbi:MAG: SH3 domain-containing protein [Eubacterium sp.]|nr:SH3 domain-containing protein [Eubacterium sp.]
MKSDRYKVLLVTAALMMSFSLTACGGNDTSAEIDKTEKTTVAETEKTTEATTQKTTEAEEEKASDTATEAKSEEKPEEEKAVTMYTTESITLHKDASKDGEDLGVVPIGSTIEAFEISGDYIRIIYDGKEGYVLKDYVTEDKAVMEKAVEASKEAAKQAQTSNSDSSASSSGDEEIVESESSSSDDDSKSETKKKKKKKNEECLDDGLLN